MASRKRTHLSIEKKAEVIKYAKDHSGIGVRALAESFGVGKTQVSEILKNKETILAAYESNASTSKKCRVSKFSDVNERLYEWYTMACSKNIYPGGPQLIAKAKKIAVRLRKTDFEGTSGWLSKWKKRYNLKRVTICGESGDVRGDTVTSWKERLPEILRGYDKRDVFNLDETGCFWRALPDCGFGQKGKQCKGGKRSKCRFTVAFLVNAEGEKETPIVIWTSETPRCFRGFNISCHPVKYYHQKNAWMSGEIFASYLTTFNQKMRSQKRSVLLLLDNVGCHPPDQLQEKFSNVKIVFLPANTTSKLQPLDLGIINNFKLHYRRFLLQYVLTKIDTATSATEVTKSINVLTAIRWVALAWREVKSTTIQKCFRNAGVLNTDLHVNALDDEDPFEDIDEDVEMSTLISRTMGSLHQCLVEEYVNGDNSLSVCVDMDDVQWDENFLDSLTEEEEPVTVNSGDEEEEFNVPPPVPKLQTFKEAVQSLEDIKIFLEDRGCFEQASTASSLLTQMASSHSSILTQSTLDQYFEQTQ